MQVKNVMSTANGFDEAVRILMHGGVVVIPTDTVYGLAAHPDFPEAVARLYSLKGREERKPIALLASDATAAERFLGRPMPPRAVELALRFWPGALTLVLPAVDGRFEGLRVPNLEWTRRLLAACGGVLRVTSANLSGQRPATDAPGALAEVGLSADLVVDGGVSPGGVASTVVKVLPDDTLDILRQGACVVND